MAGRSEERTSDRGDDSDSPSPSFSDLTPPPQKLTAERLQELRLTRRAISHRRIIVTDAQNVTEHCLTQWTALFALAEGGGLLRGPVTENA